MAQRQSPDSSSPPTGAWAPATGAAGAFPQTVALDSPIDIEGFRRHARRLFAQGTPPERVTWTIAWGKDTGDLLVIADTKPRAEVGADANADAVSAAGAGAALRVPASFLTLCQSAILHRDPRRFALMYRMLWRLGHDAALRHDRLDSDRVLLEGLAREVHRDIHKMKAFVRFRSVDDSALHENGDAGDGPARGSNSDSGDGDGDGDVNIGDNRAADSLHVAWFEPDHHIVEATAPFFQRRFTQMRWAILTPERCVRWDGRLLVFEAGANRDQAPAPDAGEQLWLTYYANIFNPARLKVAMMEREMPRRYWRNLPEAVLIAPLSLEATQRTTRMIAKDTTVASRRLPRHGAPLADNATQAVIDTNAKTLRQLEAAAQRCRACPIGEHATQAVFGEGPAHARLMVVGEQPGDQEDLRGRPFVGPAGHLFDRALSDLQWERSVLYVTNAVKHFKFEPRGKRRIHKTPGQREVEICSQWLEAEIDRVRPQAIVALGATAARALLHEAVPVMKSRGQWMARADGIPVLITLHPSALLRSTDQTTQAQAYSQWLDDLGLATDYVA